MYPMRGILGQAPGYGGGVRFQQHGGGGYLPDSGNNYGSSQMTGAGGYGNNQMSDDYGANQMGGNYGGNQMGGNYGNSHMSDNYGGNDVSSNYGGNDVSGNYGGNQMSGGYGGNQASGGYGGNQATDNYGGNQMSGGYGSNQMSSNYESDQMSGGYGGNNQMSGNYGGNQTSGNYESNNVRPGNYGNNQVRSGNFGANQRSGNFGSNQASGNFGGNQSAGNFGGNQSSGSFGGNQRSSNYGGNQGSGNFAGNQASGNFGGNQKSGNFGGNQMKSGNFGGNQKSGNYGGNQKSGNYGGNQMSGNYGGNQRSSNYGGNQRSGNFGGNQGPGNFGGNQMRPNNFGGSPARAGNFGKSPMGMNFGSRQFSRNINFPEPPIKLTELPFPVKMPRPLMEGPSFILGGRHKRYLEDDMPPYPAKRPRPAPTGPVLPPKVKNNFVVPVSEGTEKITMDIWNYFLSAKMEEADVKRKLRLRKCIMAVVNSAFPNCSLFIVGSSMTGFATKGSDVDMCLMISQEEIDQRRDASIILNCISKALRQCSCLNYRQVIKAKVPILKFFDKVSGVECDLNVNNLIGVRNTHLMRFYAYMDWRVRPLMLFIKKWARYHDINDASKQTISSYSLTLMLIHYLQVAVSPPVLPCLQETKPELFDAKQDVRLLSLNFEPHLDFVSENRATLGELFLGFLNYYANEFSFEDQIISVRLGRLLTFDEVSAQGNSMQWKYLNIEEPFERSNTARSVYEKFVFTRVLRVFKTSHQTLDKTRDLERILMRPF